MSFIGQVEKVFGNTAEFKYQLVMFGNTGLYVEGAKPIKLDDREMIFKAAAVVITVGGECLSVVELTDDCIALTGDISSVSMRRL